MPATPRAASLHVTPVSADVALGATVVPTAPGPRAPARSSGRTWTLLCRSTARSNTSGGAVSVARCTARSNASGWGTTCVAPTPSIPPRSSGLVAACAPAARTTALAIASPNVTRIR